ncbi:unnamed protein product [Lactuca virosa]|uniref:Reverse transcriptase domain-containing protein n=1 Tax=Lactuca virosa TaxID=75947 RepID=A0AAU9N9P8_9ASTR|nr:unnamed protein product [Lactuca virosa]
MPYSFDQKLGLPKLQDTRMTIRMADHSTTYPRGIIEEHPIILGRPFLSTARELVDIHDSRLTLRVENDSITFEMSPKVNHEEPIDKVSKMDAMEEDLYELVAIEKMMEEELKVWEEPSVEKVKHLKPRSSNPMSFEVIAFTTPKVQEEEEMD